MKTSFKNILLALCLAALSSGRAEEFIYVDIDGDGYADAVPLKEPGSNDGSKLCGGADDDQIVGGDGADFVKPVLPNGVTNGTPFASGNTPLAVPSNPSLPAGIMGAGIGGGPNLTPDPAQWPMIIVTSPGDGGILTSAPVNGLVITNPAGGSILSTKPTDFFSAEYPEFVRPAINELLTTTPAGGNILTAKPLGFFSAEFPEFMRPAANELLTTTPAGGSILTAKPVNGVIVNGAEIDYMRPAAWNPLTGDAGEDVIDAMLLQLMSTGRFMGDGMDDLDFWGGGGTDELVVTNPAGGNI